MKFDNLKKVTSFGDNSFTLQSNRKTVKKMLDSFEFWGRAIQKSFNSYKNAEDEDDKFIAEGSIINSLNEYVQAFSDLIGVIALQKQDTYVLNSLRSVIRYYKSEYDDNFTRDETEWVSFLQNRNDLVHDYLEWEEFYENVITVLYNYEDGVLQTVSRLRNICIELDILELVVKKVK